MMNLVVIDQQINALEKSIEYILARIEELKNQRNYLISLGNNPKTKLFSEKIEDELNQLRYDTIEGFVAMGATVHSDNCF